MKKTVSLVMTFWFALPVLFAGPIAAQSKKPNIVLIVGDDMGYADVGFHGGRGIDQRRVKDGRRCLRRRRHGDAAHAFDGRLIASMLEIDEVSQRAH